MNWPKTLEEHLFHDFAEAMSAEQQEIFRYGFRELLFFLLQISLALLAAFLLGILGQAFLFFVTLLPLRVHAGGYHASTPGRCLALSTLILLLIYGCFLQNWGSIHNRSIAALFMSVIIWIFAPVENQNKPLDSVEKTVYKRRTQIILLTEASLLTLFLFLGWTLVVTPIAMAIFIAGLAVVLGVVQQCSRFSF